MAGRFGDLIRLSALVLITVTGDASMSGRFVLLISYKSCFYSQQLLRGIISLCRG
jgi:hypothetical protein